MSNYTSNENAFFRFLNLYTPVRVDIQLQYLESGLQNLIKQVYKNKDGTDLPAEELKTATQNFIYIAINTLVLGLLPKNICKIEESRKKLDRTDRIGICLLINTAPLSKLCTYEENPPSCKGSPPPIKDPASAEKFFRSVLKPKWWKRLLMSIITLSPRGKKVQPLIDLRDGLLKFLIDHKQSFAGKSVPMKDPKDYPLLDQIYKLLQGYSEKDAGIEFHIGGYWNQLYETLIDKQSHVPPAYFQGLVHTAANYAINWNAHDYPNFAVTLVTATVFDKNMVPYLEDFGNNEPYRSLFGLLFNMIVLPPSEDKEPAAYQAWQDMLIKDEKTGKLKIDIGIRDGLAFANYLTARHYWAVLGSSAYPQLAANQIVAAFPDQVTTPSN